MSTGRALLSDSGPANPQDDSYGDKGHCSRSSDPRIKNPCLAPDASL